MGPGGTKTNRADFLGEPPKVSTRTKVKVFLYSATFYVALWLVVAAVMMMIELPMEEKNIKNVKAAP